MGWQILTAYLDLSDRWPSRRNKRLALLLPTSWTTIGLPVWHPTDKYASIGSLLKCWGLWPPADEQALQLLALT